METGHQFRDKKDRLRKHLHASGIQVLNLQLLWGVVVHHCNCSTTDNFTERLWHEAAGVSVPAGRAIRRRGSCRLRWGGLGGVLRVASAGRGARRHETHLSPPGGGGQ
eukprot:scaffold659349_cov114-Prasinocladus_malaysianus.AAC.1